MNIILNEKEFAESVLSSPASYELSPKTLGVLSKYYLSQGYRSNDIVDKLGETMLKNDPSFNAVKWHDYLESTVKYAKKTSLREIDGIPITQTEIDICKSLESKQKQRLLFALICFAKFSNATSGEIHNWINHEDKEVFKAANIITPIKRQSLMLNDLREAGFIKFGKRVDNTNICVLCVDVDGEPVLSINDFRNLGYQWGKYLGEPFIECEECGLTVKKTNNRIKYCSKCASIVNCQKTLENHNKTLH